jgi:hypothetical protein
MSIKAPLYFRIKTDGQETPVNSTGLFGGIAQVSTKVEAENRVREGQRSGAIPKGFIDSYWTRVYQGKWLVTVNPNEGGRRTRRTRRNKTRKHKTRRCKKH